MSDKPRHPAIDLPEEDRIDYLTAVASIAWADRFTHEAEVLRLREMCAALALAGPAVERVVGAAYPPAPDSLARILAACRKRGLQYALLTDATVIAFADGRVDSGEAGEIARFARELGLTTALAVLVGRYVEEVVHHSPTDALSKDLAGQLAALGAPVPQQGVVRGLFGRLRHRAAAPPG